MSLTKSQFSKMTRASRIESNKQKLDMVLLCIPSQFGMYEFGLVWLSSDLGLVWMSLVWCGRVRFNMDEFGLVWLSSFWYG